MSRPDTPTFLHLGGESFRAVDELPMGAMLLIARVDEDDPDSMREFADFLFDLIDETEEARFKKLLRRKRHTVYLRDDDGMVVLDDAGNKVIDHVVQPIGMDELNDAIGKLIEDLSARPTESRSTSQGGSATTPERSPEPSSSQDTRHPPQVALPDDAEPERPKVRKIVDLSQRTVQHVDGGIDVDAVPPRGNGSMTG